MQYETFPLNSKDEVKWQNFVYNHDNATIFHTLEWKKVIEQTFGFKHEYIVLKNSQNNLVGVCPAFKVKTLFGKAIVSQPFFEYGGPLVDLHFNRAYNDIINYYKNKCDTKKIDYVEIKALPNYESTYFEEVGYIKQFKAFDYFIEINGMNFEKDIWLGLYTNKSRIRNSVKRAIENGVSIIEDKQIDIYYDLYLNTMIKLGTPPMPKSFFENIEKYTKVRFTFAYFKDKPIGGMISFSFNNRHLLLSLVSDRKYLNLRGNYLLFNDQIEYAAKNGLQLIDFGRTKPESGHERYKKKWGAKRVDMFSYVYPPSAAENTDPYKYYDRFSRFTKKIPQVLKKMGPIIVKKFP